MQTLVFIWIHTELMCFIGLNILRSDSIHLKVYTFCVVFYGVLITSYKTTMLY